MRPKFLVCSLRRFTSTSNFWVFAEGLLSRIQAATINTTVILGSPLHSLSYAQALLGNKHPNIRLAVNDLSLFDAFNPRTEVMLKGYHCNYQLIGCPETRIFSLASEGLLAEEVRLCKLFGLVPVVCIGETFAEWASGMTTAVLRRQVGIIRPFLGPNDNTLLAYCPLGPSRLWSLSHLRAVHLTIKGFLREQQLPVLCGSAVSANQQDSVLSLGYRGFYLEGTAVLQTPAFFG